MIGDRNDFSRIGKKQIEQLEKLLGLKTGHFSQRLRRIDHNVLDIKDRVAKEVNRRYPKAKIPTRLAELIEKRSKSLRQQKAF